MKMRNIFRRNEEAAGRRRASHALILMTALVTLLALPTSGFAAAPEGFIENRGQIDESVRFYATGSMVSIFLTEDAVVIDLKPPVAAAALGGKKAPSDEPLHGCALWIRFAGERPAREIEARDTLATYYNFFLGNDPQNWHADVPAFGEVVYHDLWPGIDLVFRQEAGHVTYEVLSAEGSDPDQLRFRYEGADVVSRNEDGSYLIETPRGKIVDVRPRPGKRYGEFRWALGSPAANDQETPTGKENQRQSALQWSTYLGGNSLEEASCIALDIYQNSVVAGMTSSTDFPVTAGAYDQTYDGLTDAFVAKVDVYGTSLLWATYLGGFFGEEVMDLTLDGAGNPLLTGWTQSHDFPTTSGAYDESYNGGSDVFVARLSSYGNALFWSTYLGGSGTDEPYAIARDIYADVYITGQTQSSDFPTTNGAYDQSHNGDYDLFVAKVHGAGNQLLWSTFVGGSGADVGIGLVLDPSSNVIVTGSTYSPGFPTTTGAFDESYNYGSGGDAFLTKLNSAGSALQWSTYLGASSMDVGRALTIDASQNPIVCRDDEFGPLPHYPRSVRHDTERVKRRVPDQVQLRRRFPGLEHLPGRYRRRRTPRSGSGLVGPPGLDRLHLLFRFPHDGMRLRYILQWRLRRIDLQVQRRRVLAGMEHLPRRLPDGPGVRTRDRCLRSRRHYRENTLQRFPHIFRGLRQYVCTVRDDLRERDGISRGNRGR